jgi:hypothetical protein
MDSVFKFGWDAGDSTPTKARRTLFSATQLAASIGRVYDKRQLGAVTSQHRRSIQRVLPNFSSNGNTPSIDGRLDFQDRLDSLVIAAALTVASIHEFFFHSPQYLDLGANQRFLQKYPLDLHARVCSDSGNFAPEVEALDELKRDGHLLQVRLPGNDSQLPQKWAPFDIACDDDFSSTIHHYPLRAGSLSACNN